jgi:hypothetical protein
MAFAKRRYQRVRTIPDNAFMQRNMTHSIVILSGPSFHVKLMSRIAPLAFLSKQPISAQSNV